VTQEGDLIASFTGALNPTRLPRSRTVPIAVRVAGGVKNATPGHELAQLQRISVAINSAGVLYDRGLPTCQVKTIQPATEAAAKSICGSAIVGDGHVSVQVHLPTQTPFEVTGKLLAFNGPRKHGHKRILAQVYSAAPPGAFILPFVVKKAGGVYGTTMTTVLPKGARDWAYLTHFDMTLHRTYTYRGKRRSYISAACAAPDGFPGAVFPFAKASYGFDNGSTLVTTVQRRCRVRR
jgi:hypothetical protein